MNATRCEHCNKDLEFAKGGSYYFIEGHNYCIDCGRHVNEERKPELQKAMFQEIYFGDEM